MKNFILICLFSMIYFNVGSSKTTSKGSFNCAQFAANMLELVEAKEGCMDTDVYNAAYYAIKGKCDEMMGQ